MRPTKSQSCNTTWANEPCKAAGKASGTTGEVEVEVEVEVESSASGSRGLGHGTDQIEKFLIRIDLDLSQEVAGLLHEDCAHLPSTTTRQGHVERVNDISKALARTPPSHTAISFAQCLYRKPSLEEKLHIHPASRQIRAYGQDPPGLSSPMSSKRLRKSPQRSSMASTCPRRHEPIDEVSEACRRARTWAGGIAMQQDARRKAPVSRLYNTRQSRKQGGQPMTIAQDILILRA